MDQGKKLTNTSSSTSASNGSTHKASDMIQDTIDVVDNFPRSSSSSSSSSSNDTSSPSTTTNNNNNNNASSSSTSNNTTTSSLTHIDNTLNALGDTYPFSNEHRARPHSSTLSSSSSMANKSSVANDAMLRSQLGAHFQPGLANYNHPYNPLHWGNVGALRNPYGAPYGQSRTATKTSQGKNAKNPRAQSYEDKMDKQRLEHILFSGDQSGPLNQQKERMRQKLADKKQNKKNGKGKNKKKQTLPNGSNNNGLLTLNQGRNQKANGDNGGYFLTEISKPSSNESNNSKNKKNRGNNKQRNGRRQQKNNKKEKKQNKKGKRNNKKSRNSNQSKKKHQNNQNHQNGHHVNNGNNNKDNNNNNNINNNKKENPKSEGISASSSNGSNKSALNKLDSTIDQIDRFNQGYGEKSNHEQYMKNLPNDGLSILDTQNDIFEQEPDEYFQNHAIEPLMQNKIKLEMNQQIPGISIWRDKKELEPLLSSNNNGSYGTDNYHRNNNPDLVVSNNDNDNKQNDENENEMNDDDGSDFVDNFVDVSENEGDEAIKNKNHVSNFSSNSNDSEIDGIGDLINEEERDLIKSQSDLYDNNNTNNNIEPGSVPTALSNPDIQSNPQLMQIEASLKKDNNNNSNSKQRRNSALLNSSMTSTVDPGLCDAEDEEKHIEEPITTKQTPSAPSFNAGGITPNKKVKFVDENENEENMFSGMNVNEDEDKPMEKDEDKPVEIVIDKNLRNDEEIESGNEENKEQKEDKEGEPEQVQEKNESCSRQFSSAIATILNAANGDKTKNSKNLNEEEREKEASEVQQQSKSKQNKTAEIWAQTKKLIQEKPKDKDKDNETTDASINNNKDKDSKPEIEGQKPKDEKKKKSKKKDNDGKSAQKKRKQQGGKDEKKGKNKKDKKKDRKKKKDQKAKQKNNKNRNKNKNKNQNNKDNNNNNKDTKANKDNSNDNNTEPPALEPLDNVEYVSVDNKAEDIQSPKEASVDIESSAEQAQNAEEDDNIETTQKSEKNKQKLPKEKDGKKERKKTENESVQKKSQQNNNNNKSKAQQQKNKNAKKKKKRKKKNKRKQRQDENNNNNEQNENEQPNKDNDKNNNNNDNYSDDDTMDTITVGSSSNAPSSIQYQDSLTNDGDGWITKTQGKKSKKTTKGGRNKRDNRRSNSDTNVLSSPISAHDSTPKSVKGMKSPKSFGYGSENEPKSNQRNKKKNNNDDKHQHNDNKHQNKKQKNKKQKSNNNQNQNMQKKKPPLPPSKSASHTDIVSQSNNNKTKANKKRSRNERRKMAKLNSDPMMKIPPGQFQPNKSNQNGGNVIRIPQKYNKVIPNHANPSMKFPKINNVHPATSAPDTKTAFPPLNKQQSNKVYNDTMLHNKHNRKNKRDIKVNLDILSPPPHGNMTPTPTSLGRPEPSTPGSTHSADDRHQHQRNKRPKKPPITRLNPTSQSKKNINAMTPPATHPSFGSSQSADNHMDMMIQTSKPPLPAQKSAPLHNEIPTQTWEDHELSPNNGDIIRDHGHNDDFNDNNNNKNRGNGFRNNNMNNNNNRNNMNMNMNRNNNNNNNNISNSSPPLPPPSSGFEQNKAPQPPSLPLPENNAQPPQPQATHVAVWQTENGQMQSIPILMNSYGAAVMQLPAISTNNSSPDDNQTPIASLPMTLPALPTALPVQSPADLGLPNILPGLSLPTAPLPIPANLTNAPLPTIPPIASINAGIPVLLPGNFPALPGHALPGQMPAFTTEQLAKIQLNNPNLPLPLPTAAPALNTTNTTTTNTNSPTTKTSSTFQPTVPAFTPSTKSQKLEDIKEEDEHDRAFDDEDNEKDTKMNIDIKDKDKDTEETDDSPSPRQEDEEILNAEEYTVEEEDTSREQSTEHEQKCDEMTMRDNIDSSVIPSCEQYPLCEEYSIAQIEPKSEKECLEDLRNDLIEDEREENEDEWVEIADLDSSLYPATLWCLHVKSFHADPQCSLKKLQAQMASALLSS